MRENGHAWSWVATSKISRPKACQKNWMHFRLCGDFSVKNTPKVVGVRALRPGPGLRSPLIGVPKEELGERTGLGQRRLKGPQTEVGGW